MPQFRPNRAEKIRALTQFLSAAFGVDELRRLIAYNFGDEGQGMIDEVNFRDTKANVVGGVIGALLDKQQLPALWVALRAERPRRGAEIAELERVFMWHQVPAGEKIEVLIAVADVDTRRPLDLKAELATIEREARGAPHGQDFEFVIRENVSWDGFRTDAVIEVRPHVVQFSGHGNEAGTFLFAGPKDGVDGETPAEMFAGLMTAQQGKVSLVVLNACYSEAVADRLRRDIEAVIGMKTAIYDDAAIRFSSILYRSLAQGCTIAEAFDVARNELIRLEAQLGPRLK